MKVDNKAVKITDKETGKLKEVARVDCPVYENLEELMAKEKPDIILGLFNKANAIRIQGNERAKHQPARAGKTAMRAQAFNLLSPKEIAKFAGNFKDLQTFLDSDEMTKRLEAATKATG